MIPSVLAFPQEVERVERCIAGFLQRHDGLFGDAASAILAGSGKKLRPRIVMLISRSLGAKQPADDRAIHAAACAELVHVASLIHDDVIDRAETRRGHPSVNAQFGNDVAILMADFLYAQAFELAIDSVDPEILRLIAGVTRAMCHSEVRQIEKRGTMLSEEDYLGIIEAKTAALFAACAEIGAILAGCDTVGRQAASHYGLDIGMAYQITDDALDYTGGDGNLGKPVGNDLQQGKQTLPLLHTFRQASEPDRKALTESLNNGREMKTVLPIIRKYGGLEYCEKRARQFAERAAQHIPRIGATREPQGLETLCRFVVERAR